MSQPIVKDPRLKNTYSLPSQFPVIQARGEIIIVFTIFTLASGINTCVASDME